MNVVESLTIYETHYISAQKEYLYSELRSLKVDVWDSAWEQAYVSVNQELVRHFVGHVTYKRIIKLWLPIDVPEDNIDSTHSRY